MSTAEFVARSQAASEWVRPLLLDERTLDILRRRERGAIMTRRGWLVRRMLALSDVFGLTMAFVFSLLMFAGEGQSNTASDATEILIFLLTVPSCGSSLLVSTGSTTPTRSEPTTRPPMTCSAFSISSRWEAGCSSSPPRCPG